MRRFYDDTDYARSIQARIASYSVLLLDAGKSIRMACSTISLVGALSCKSMPAPVWREASLTLRINQPSLSWSTSGWGSSAKKYSNTYPFNPKRGLYRILNLISSITHRAILLDRLSLCTVFHRGRMVSTPIGCA